jgi:protocatechuate 3,4-dioxygenase beta subunit
VKNPCRASIFQGILRPYFSTVLADTEGLAVIARLLLATGLALIISPGLWAQSESEQAEGVVITDEFVICPITTDLQRSLIDNDAASVYVFVNGAAFRGVETIDRFHPVFEELQKKLTELAVGDNPGIAFTCRDDTEGEGFEKVKKRLETLSKVSEEVAYYAGFLNVKTSQTYLAEKSDWKAWIDRAQAKAKLSESQEEPVTGNERVQVFFVQTFLSHLKSNADCIVTILPVVRTASSFPDEFMPDLEKYLLPKKGDKLRSAMLLNISFTPSLEEEINTWIEDIEGRHEFARKLGFENCNVSPGPTNEPDGLTQGPATRLSIKVKVLGPDGEPVPNPKFETRTYPQMNVQTTSSPQGTIFKIAGRPRFFHFMVKMPGYAPYIGRWDASDHPEKLPTEFTAKLGKGWRIGGIVVDEDGKPVAGAEVNPSIEFEKRPGDNEQFGTGDRVTTDAEGRWSYPSVPDTDQEVNVEISHPDVMPGWMTLARATYEIKEGEEPHAEIKRERGIVLTGQVVDESGQPIAGANLKTQISNVLRQATTDKEGKFTLTGCKAGPTRVVIYAPGKATMLEIVDAAADMQPLELTMQPGGHLRIRVLDPDGKPSPKARVFLQEWKGSVNYFEFDHINTYADDNGVWEWNEAPLEEFVADISPRQGMQLPRQKFKARAEEYVVTLNRPLEISGTVVDAETKQPIEKFRVVPGRSRGQDDVFWNENDSFEVADGKFSQRIDYPGEGHLVRIEANGYEPAESRTVKPTEGAVSVTVELHKGENIEATVLKPNGEPALEAVVYLGRPGSQIMLKNGYLDEGSTYAPKLSIDATGKISFMEIEGPFQIIVADDSGFANIKSVDGPIPSEIKLQPWAKVKGVFMIGAAPAANITLYISTQDLYSFDSKGPRVFTSYNLTTDDKGRFEGNRFNPGQASIGRQIMRMVDTGATEVTSSIMVRLNLKAGETTEVRLGGTGRPVVGQFLPVEGATKIPLWRMAQVHISAGKQPKFPERPKDLKTPEEQTKWWQNWIKTDAGKTWQKQQQAYQKVREASPYFNASVNRDGKFRIDDMPAGDYGLSLHFDDRADGYVSSHVFAIPPMEGERSDEPFDLGEIRLEKPPQN